MDAVHEFRYRLPRRAGGQRPGSHRGTALGTGLEFLTHARLFDRPDPRPDLPKLAAYYTAVRKDPLVARVMMETHDAIARAQARVPREKQI